jgi:peptidoglycan/LPS O-acetylase OafA/YrhL
VQSCTHIHFISFVVVLASSIESDRKRYPQLDGVRAFAIIAVFIGHFLGDRFIAELVGWGDTGVILFFCLSGFLITEILLRIDPSPDTRVGGIKAFYARRVLRIFPIYYLVILTGVAIGYPPIQEHFWRLVTYSLNIPMLPVTENVGAASHFWSLNVEEQFYLIWPTVVVFFPRQRLKGLVMIVILASLAYKFLLALMGFRYTLIFSNVLGCMDSLGLGAFLAVHRNQNNSATLSPFVKIGAFAALAWIALTVIRIILHVDPWYKGHLPFAVAHFACGAVAFTGLVAFALKGSRNLLGRILQNRLARYIGKISYGLYVYHFFMPLVLSRAQAKGFLTISGDLQMALYCTVLSVCVAVLSWHFFERPILQYKQYFEYSAKKAQPAPAVAEASG